MLNVYIVCMARFRYKCVNTLNYLASRRNRSNADTAATIKINWNIIIHHTIILCSVINKTENWIITIKYTSFDICYNFWIKIINNLVELLEIVVCLWILWLNKCNFYHIICIFHFKTALLLGFKMSFLKLLEDNWNQTKKRVSHILMNLSSKTWFQLQILYRL